MYVLLLLLLLLGGSITKNYLQFPKNILVPDKTPLCETHTHTHKQTPHAHNTRTHAHAPNGAAFICQVEAKEVLRQEAHRGVAQERGDGAFHGALPGHDAASTLGIHDLRQDGPIHAHTAPGGRQAHEDLGGRDLAEMLEWFQWMG